MKYYTVSEVARKYGVSKETIYKRIREGVINKVPNIGAVTRIPASELEKFDNNKTKEESKKFTCNLDKIEIIKTHLGKVRKIKSNDYYILGDITKALGFRDSYSITRRIETDMEHKKFVKVMPTKEALALGLFANQFGIAIINYAGILEYSKSNHRCIDWDKFLNELKPSNGNAQVEFEEVKNVPVALSKVFEDTPVEIIVDSNGEPLFELYSTGMALGYVTSNGYAYKDRINKVLKNGDIKAFSHGVKKYLTESMLYDFMLEAKTDKCKSFRKWVTNEVLPTINRTGGYVNNTERFTENYFSNLSEDTREAIKNELENKNKDLRLKKTKIEHELKSNTEIINLINEA